ncbi:EAL domain-containing protein [Lichenihabitans sp. PAMC28606]|uniref:putative bifunctional diguanylate cyclase/phosphodiesterase n=1 Tax=Lichenihabitans sp. PAMC28606 TaxID=2880932 RepID=UPI001D0B1814|nr:EAL domain-containing protein [Lichenihabitans sp. PAMC28606]UDL94053.1 EAL domain-containing protein [Lichenihabitans sp. PAMC28606]
MKEPAAPDLYSALDGVSWPVLVTAMVQGEHVISYANAAFSAMCGHPIAELVGRDDDFLDGLTTDRSVKADMQAVLTEGRGIRRTIVTTRKDGTPYRTDVAIDPIRNASGRVTHLISIYRPTDDTGDPAATIGEVDTNLPSIAEHLPGYIYRVIMRTDGTIDTVYRSASLAQMLGTDNSQVMRTFDNLVYPDDHDAVYAALRKSAAGMSVFREEFRLVASNGTLHWLRSRAMPRRTPNGEITWDGIAIESSAEERWESEIANQASRDPLTGLLTRAAWLQALESELTAERSESATCAVICSDISAFSALNERLGQIAGDTILRETAKRLAKLAASIGGVAARLGGDEFAIMIPDCADQESLSLCVGSLSEAFAQPMQIGTECLTVLTCIGATFNQRLENETMADKGIASEVMTQAEIALRWAKQSGRNTPMLYSPEQDDRHRNEAVLARSLEHAIANDELELHYQPLVELASGRIVSAEALVRWKHPTLGMQRPDRFIPLAETSGLIVPLGRWVLEQAFRQHRLWTSAGLAPPPVAVNVSGNQLMEPGFVALVEEALKSQGANAANFEIELTEGLLVEPSPQIMASLHALRTMGFTIAIDDFGSGHATFRYLRDFPVDKLKIDQIFVRKLVLESTDALIIRAIISLARSMGIGLVAEGIETDMQRSFLQQEGCAVGQGYLFSMPLVAEDFTWMLAHNVSLPMRGPVEQAVPGSPTGPDAVTGAQLG